MPISPQNLREQFQSFARFYAGSFHLFPRELVWEVGIEPTQLSRQIYSLVCLSYCTAPTNLVATKTRDGFIASQIKLALLSGNNLHF